MWQSSHGGRRSRVFAAWLAALWAIAATGAAVGEQTTPAGSAAPLTLRGAVERALAGHPQMEGATARLEAARAQVRQAQAAFWPTLVAAAEYDEKELPLSALGMGPLLRGPFTPDTVKSVVYREGLGFRLPLYQGDRDRQGLAIARLGQKAAQHEVSGVRDSLIALAIEAYVQHEKARELLKSAEEHETATRAQLQSVVRNIEAGMGVRFDRLQVEVRLEAAREAVLVGRNAVDSARTALNLAMGGPPSEPVETLPVGTFPAIVEPLPDLQREMLERNPALDQVRRQVEAAGRKVAYEKGGNRPTAALSGSLSNFGTDLPVRERGWTVTGTMEWKVFDGGFTRARVDEARHRHEAARAGLEDLQNQLLASLEKAFLDHRSAQQRLEVSRKGLELAREQMRLSEIQREAGYITLTELLDKQAELTRARVTLIGARYDTYLSALTVLRLTGRLTPSFLAGLGG